MSFQRHFKRSEIWMVSKGSCIVNYSKDDPNNKKNIQLNKFDHYLVPVGNWHQITNPFEETCHLIEIQYGEACIEDDIERTEYYSRSSPWEKTRWALLLGLRSGPPMIKATVLHASLLLPLLQVLDLGALASRLLLPQAEGYASATHLRHRPRLCLKCISIANLQMRPTLSSIPENLCLSLKLNSFNTIAGLQRQGAQRGTERVAKETQGAVSCGSEARAETSNKPAHSRSVMTSSASEMCSV